MSIEMNRKCFGDELSEANIWNEVQRSMMLVLLLRGHLKSRTRKMLSPKIKNNNYNMKTILLILLALIAIVMVFMGIKGSVLPPVFTGIGFIIIAVFLYKYS